VHFSSFAILSRQIDIESHTPKALASMNHDAAVLCRLSTPGQANGRMTDAPPGLCARTGQRQITSRRMPWPRAQYLATGSFPALPLKATAASYFCAGQATTARGIMRRRP
jgi:hypothetical protein